MYRSPALLRLAEFPSVATPEEGVFIWLRGVGNSSKENICSSIGVVSFNIEVSVGDEMLSFGERDMKALQEWQGNVQSPVCMALNGDDT